MSVFECTVVVNNSVQKVYDFLADMNNHRQLMPDNITDWLSTTDEVSFNIENITKLYLKIEERVKDKLVKIIPVEKPPFDMELKWELISQGANTRATFTISADLNMLMKMLASYPLKKLTKEETDRLSKLLNTL